MTDFSCLPFLAIASFLFLMWVVDTILGGDDDNEPHIPVS